MNTMEVNLVHHCENVDWRALSGLFESVNWKGRAPEKLARAFRASYKVIFAYSDNTLIGCIRVVSDGEFYAMLFDLVVDPTYQRQGIGQQLTEAALEELKGMPWISLSSTPGHESLFTKFGFLRQRSAMAIVQDPFSEYLDI